MIDIRHSLRRLRLATAFLGGGCQILSRQGNNSSINTQKDESITKVFLKYPDIQNKKDNNPIDTPSEHVS